ncbi:hypothetical protein IWW36_003876 [Coemansia brasiliensis]|uniref:Small ribosomal subunit protein mS41 n=1 Tax=Coemansia brasiliensis TaxID=2650707 RepID=A0A9W8ID76_9FUNG|nr:hypothetical protein IWW36_003876 [Coemansia brasiliensis]
MFARLALKPAIRSVFVRAASTDAESLSKATIGRGCEKFAAKFDSWEDLFKADSLKMKTELGIGPKQRKWILRWTNHFRLGIDPYFIPTSKKHEMTRAARLARSKRRRKH